MNRKLRLVTRGHKTLGVKWLFDFWFSRQSLLYLDSEVAPKSPTFHTAIRCASWLTASYKLATDRKMMRKELLILIFGLIGFYSSKSQTNEKIVIDKDIQLIHLQDSIFVHVTWHHLDNFGRFPSNGMIVIRNGQALMIDTPMDNVKTERLTKYLKDSMSVDLTKLIIGHFHDDCMGGLGYLKSIGVESIANSMTIEKCKELGLPIASTPFTDSLTFYFNGEQIDCRYFGAGHSFDNITVLIPNKKILFGGCLVKSVNSKGLGNLSDAVVADWDLTIEMVMQEYSEINIVIPGHGNYGGRELLSHTIELVKNEKEKND